MNKFYYHGCSSVLLKSSLCTQVTDKISETEFWVKSTERALLFCQQKGSQLSALKTVCPALEGVVSSLILLKEQGVISLWMFFWLTGGEVIGSRHHPPSGSNRPGVSELVGSVQSTSPRGGGSNNAKQFKGQGSEYYLQPSRKN